MTNLFTCVVVIALFICGSPLRAASRPNVILLMADDLGWGDLGFNGNPVIRTPNLDAMAAAGLKFERFYAAAPVCSPTRGSALTGRHPSRYGITNANAGHMPAEELTLGELLKGHGYTTGHFGKWHLGVLTKTEKDANRGGPRNAEHYSPPWEHGFDVCFSTESKVPTWNPMIKQRGASESGLWPPELPQDQRENYGTAYWTAEGVKAAENLEGDDARVIMDRAVPFIERAAAEKRPFLAVIWFHTPHLPVIAGQKYLDIYAEVPGASERHRNYYGCITAMDEQVGRLARTLHALKIADDTLIFFCSDNGPEGNAKAPGSAGPFRGRKRDLYEGGVRVAAFAVWPGQIRPGATSVPAVTSDYLPTVAEIVGEKLPADRDYDGMSLLPLLRGEMTQRPRPIGFDFKGEAAWHEGPWKLLVTKSGTALYDVVADPGETKDLASRHPQVVERMKNALEAWRVETLSRKRLKENP